MSVIWILAFKGDLIFRQIVWICKKLSSRKITYVNQNMLCNVVVRSEIIASKIINLSGESTTSSSKTRGSNFEEKSDVEIIILFQQYVYFFSKSSSISVFVSIEETFPYILELSKQFVRILYQKVQRN